MIRRRHDSKRLVHLNLTAMDLSDSEEIELPFSLAAYGYTRPTEGRVLVLYLE